MPLGDYDDIHKFYFPSGGYEEFERIIKDNYSWSTTERGKIDITPIQANTPPGNGFMLHGPLAIQWAETFDSEIRGEFNAAFMFIAPSGIDTVLKDQRPGSKQAVLRINLCDERILWQYMGIVRGDRNMESLEGIPYTRRVGVTTGGVKLNDGLTTHLHPYTIKGNRPFTLKDLLIECIEALPHPEVHAPASKYQYHISPWTQYEVPLNCKWGGGRLAAEALGELLAEYCLVLALGWDGKIRITAQYEKCPENEASNFLVADSGDENRTKHLMEYLPGTQFFYRPWGAHVYSTKPIHVECEQTCKAIIHANNKIYTLVEYCHELGFPYANLAKSFLKYSKDDKNMLDWVKDEAARKILLEQAFRTYQVDNTTYLPMVPRRVIHEDGSLSTLEIPPEVFCDLIGPAPNWRMDGKFWQQIESRQTITGKIDIDAKLGIIHLPEPVFLAAVKSGGSGAAAAVAKAQASLADAQRAVIAQNFAWDEAVRQMSQAKTAEARKSAEAALDAARRELVEKIAAFNAALKKLRDATNKMLEDDKKQEYVNIEGWKGLEPAIVKIRYAFESKRHWSATIGELKYAKPFEVDWQLYEVRETGQSNKFELEAEANYLVAKSIQDTQAAVDVATHKFAGAHAVQPDGQYTQVIIESTGDNVITTIRENEYVTGYMGRKRPTLHTLMPIWRRRRRV